MANLTVLVVTVSNLSAIRYGLLLMTKVNSHYDNLKVDRNASPEVIRAAYRSLSQKHHPDLNPDNSNAANIMSMLNVAYDTLSDPDKRRAHDSWIMEREAHEFAHQSRVLDSSIFTASYAFSGGMATESDQSSPPVEAAQETCRYQSKPRSPLVEAIKALLNHIARYWFVYGLVLLGLVGWASEEFRSPFPRQVPYIDAPGPSDMALNQLNNTVLSNGGTDASPRPLGTVNGLPRPVSTDYAEGHRLLNISGFATVTIDNVRNNSDVFFKLVALDGAQPYPVRSFFIFAHSSVTIEEVPGGSYEIRYRDLNAGGLLRSESFVLQQRTTAQGTQFSHITMTLFKVRNGNM